MQTAKAQLTVEINVSYQRAAYLSADQINSCEDLDVKQGHKSGSGKGIFLFETAINCVLKGSSGCQANFSKFVLISRWSHFLPQRHFIN